MKLGLFYGSTTCYTEMAAEKIQPLLADNFTVELSNIKEVSLSHCLNYDLLIFGISTWDYGELQEDWESHWQELSELDLTNKVVALYGMGDQIGYTEWFQDALGMLHQVVTDNGAFVIGLWPNIGYEFAASKALTDDNKHFVGLALDEDNQYDLSDQRIKDWCQQVTREINQLLAE